jgi:hypothetical protein
MKNILMSLMVVLAGCGSYDSIQPENKVSESVAYLKCAENSDVGSYMFGAPPEILQLLACVPGKECENDTYRLNIVDNYNITYKMVGNDFCGGGVVYFYMDNVALPYKLKLNK